MRRDIPRGITLIELLVVAALIGLSSAILLPALQSARATARQATCVGNLKQIGLAALNYHTAFGVLPMSQVRGEGHSNGHSVLMLISPFAEQVAVFNACNFWNENYHIVNQTAVSARIAAYLCPDNPSVETMAAAEVRYPDSRSTFAKAHYGANWGGGRSVWGEGGGGYRRTPPRSGFGGPWGDDFAKNRGIYLGVLMTVLTGDGEAKAGDGKPRARNISLKDITDGASFTLAMVEKRDSFGWAVGGWGGSEFDVDTSPAYRGDDPLARKVYGGSTHADGPNGLNCDGSFRRLGPKMDRNVWYALITRAGGEAITPDR
jgi:prepilin-type N-terminal cleavage/methylation domain-containing protein